MICRPDFSRLSARRAGFTLVELLTVIAIILVLAGLLLYVAGNANYKSSFARAQTEVKAMETALESYKADNGTYPRTATAGQGTDSINAQSNNDPGSGSSYTDAGKILFQALSGVPSAAGGTYGKRYMDFKSGQLSSGTADPSATTYVIDPFGLAYGYSTRGAYGAEQKQTNANLDTSTYGYNPTFDLWSTGGYGAGGRQYSKSGLSATAYNTLWAKNW